ncbi:MAG: anthranilate synthase component II [Kangiellaceae bacterium]
MPINQPHVLMIDNFDSFTFNLVHYLESLNAKVTVKRNNEVTLKEIQKLKPSHIVISPGPGTPDDAGISLALVNKFKGVVPILGVCLGHQVIAQEAGAVVGRAQTVMHGKTSRVNHKSVGVFKNLPQGFNATRYHSLVIDQGYLPKELEVTAWSGDYNHHTSEIMGIEIKNLNLYGVQFHPESVASEHGQVVLKNFLLTIGRKG